MIKYILRSLLYFRRQNLAVMAATIISTAVLTGALIIGDSVRYTLRNMVDIRLGKARYAMPTGDRFVRSQLAKDISEKLQTDASALIAVQSIAINPENNSRINKANVYGIDSSFWKFAQAGSIELADDEVLINENIALKLNLNTGNEILLRIENAEIIPINTPFASTENPSVSQRFKVKAVLNKEQLGRFSLKSNQAEPYNIFIAQKILAQKLEIEGLSNLILIADNQEETININRIDSILKEKWQLQDIGLKIKGIGEKNKYELVSDRIFIEDRVGNAIKEAEKEPVLTYLVNSIKKGNHETPYSFVAAITQSQRNTKLSENEIIINEWLAGDLGVSIGDSLELTYYIIGPLRQLTEKTEKFRVKEIISLEKSEFLKSLMPDFPGITEAGSCSEWETGVPIDLDKIRDKDEAYWNIYKGTPKAFISIESGQKLWKNQFGNLTALRFDSTNYNPAQLKKDILESLKPQDFNLVFIPVYQQGIDATVNAVDFGELFLSLSFFVIAAGILLTILIHVFNSFTRSSETGLLSGLGFTKKQVFRIKLFESLFVLVPAGILGAIFGIAYNYLIMAGINSVWNDVVRTNMIEISIKSSTLLIGSISGILISFISIYLANRKILKQQVANVVKSNYRLSPITKKNKSFKYLGIIILLIGIVLVSISIFTSVEANSAMFLVSGALSLLALVFLISYYFDYQQQKIKDNSLTTNGLILKNTGRNKSRSIATILLLAFGAFVIFITGANRRTFAEATELNQSGTGGYLFWAETSLPLPYNLNTVEGRQKMGFSEGELPEELIFTQFHNLEGDDASCLNLNQVQKPQILGVNEIEFNKRKSFSFARLLSAKDETNPWLALSNAKGNGIIPAVADQTVLEWGLKKTVGDTLIYLNEKGEQIKIQIVGSLNNSIFQGNLLISDSLFRLNFPSAGGSRIMLLDAPKQYRKKIQESLNNTLVDYGIELSPTTQRLAEFSSVTNTYLSVFMALGGLGMIIGTIGLGIVLLRNIQERKGELALMLALGFTKAKLTSIIIRENLYLLVSGLLIGLIASVFGILPSLLSPSFEIPGGFMFILISVVFINGFLWIYFPVRLTIRLEIVGILKEE